MIIDAAAGDRASVQSRTAIEDFAVCLVDAIGMRSFGEPVVVHFAEHDPDTAGYSLVQLIETSSITGHFVDRTGDFYLDVFSCSGFDPDTVLRVVRDTFRPERDRHLVIERSAPRG
jgi:S-adenosylmethionine/arginine decarboxylase-like enzyme